MVGHPATARHADAIDEVVRASPLGAATGQSHTFPDWACFKRSKDQCTDRGSQCVR